MRAHVLLLALVALPMAAAVPAAAQAQTVCGVVQPPCETSLEIRLRELGDPLPPSPDPGWAQVQFRYAYDSTYAPLAGHETRVHVDARAAEEGTVAVDPAATSFSVPINQLAGSMGSASYASTEPFRLRCHPGFEGIAKVVIRAVAEENGIYGRSDAIYAFHVACLAPPAGAQDGAAAEAAPQDGLQEEGTYHTAAAGGLLSLPLAPLAAGVGLASVVALVPRAVTGLRGKR